MKIWVFPEEINIVLKNRLKSMGWERSQQEEERAPEKQAARESMFSRKYCLAIMCMTR
jgi:hypothetical protein